MLPMTVLLDAVGTLFRVRGSVGQLYARVARRHGVCLDPTIIEGRFRDAFAAMPPLAFPGVPAADVHAREYDWWRTVVSAVFSGAHFHSFDAFFDELFHQFAHAESWELFPDTRPALAALRGRGLRLAMVSNFDARLHDLCDALGLTPWFAAIVISTRAGAAKPDPLIFRTALIELGASAGEAVHVGDSEREDVAGALAAGIRAVHLDRTLQGPPSSDRVRDLCQLLAIL
jgi:putative hydrolase of the HAD superfamily